jgi:hypothetical protein
MAPYASPGGPAAPGAFLGAGTLPSAGATSGPKRRNALMTLLMPVAVIFGGSILGTILGIIYSPLALLAPLMALAGWAWLVLISVQMTNELKAVTRNDAFAWWPILVPGYQIYWACILVPQEVTKAKQMVGARAPTRSIVLYIFLFPFAFASDLNDMAR